ncbi:MAG: hypothetical protein ACJAYU_004456 [Bradymonadia bacterium]|jgi:hypothetical protein
MSVTILTDTEEEGIRLARRRRLEAEIVLLDPDGFGAVALPCRDVSVTGLFVYSSACVRPGSEFICRVPMDDGSIIEAAGTVSRVVLNEEEPTRSGMGIRFTQLAREARDRILAFTLPPEGALAIN